MAMQHRNQLPWTYEQRVCLHILWDEHIMSNDQRANVFNEIFKDKLAAGGTQSLGRTSSSMSMERFKRRNIGSPSQTAWRDVHDSPDRLQQHSAIDDMRNRIDSLLKSNSGDECVTPATPPRFDLHDPTAQFNVFVCDVERFARFTGSLPVERSIAALCTPSPSIDGHSDGSSNILVANRSCLISTPRENRRTAVVVIPKFSDSRALRDIDYVEETSMFNCISTQRAVSAGNSISTRKSGSITKARKRKNTQELVPYTRMGNTSLMLSPSSHRNALPAETPYKDIREEDAHPPLPSLLWRYWGAASHGTNSTSGFKSGKSTCARAPSRAPPLCKDFDWNDFIEHHNPLKHREHPLPSPFVSTTSRLIWLLRKSLRKNDLSGRISLIESSILDPKAVYYAPPFHEEAQRHKVFDNGAQYYKEFLNTSFGMR